MMNETERRHHQMMMDYEADAIMKIEEYVKEGHERKAVLQFPDVRASVSAVFCNYHSMRAHFTQTQNTEELKALETAENRFNDIIHGVTKKKVDIKDLMAVLEGAYLNLHNVSKEV